MRGLVTAALVFLLGVFAQPIGERCMKDAPDALWRWISVMFFAAAVAVALLTDPFFGYVKAFRQNPFSSTAIIGGCAAILSSAVWLFLIVGFSSSDGRTTNQAITELSNIVTDQGNKIANLTIAIIQNPSLPVDLRLQALKEENERLSKSRELSVKEKEALSSQALTLQSLEEGRKKHLEAEQLKSQQAQLAMQREKLEQEERAKAREPQEIAFSKQYAAVIDFTITTLYDMLKQISSQSIETLSPTERPSLYNSEIYKNGKIVGGVITMRVGDHDKWKVSLGVNGPPDGLDQSVIRHLRISVSSTTESGGAAATIFSIPAEPPLLRVNYSIARLPGLIAPMHGLKPEWEQDCSMADYEKPIEQALRDLIQNLYNSIPLTPKPPSPTPNKEVSPP